MIDKLLLIALVVLILAIALAILVRDILEARRNPPLDRHLEEAREQRISADFRHQQWAQLLDRYPPQPKTHPHGFIQE